MRMFAACLSGESQVSEKWEGVLSELMMLNGFNRILKPDTEFSAFKK